MGAQVQVATLKHRQGDGAYSIALESGTFTGVAAGSATAGFLWALRWAPVTGVVAQTLVLTRLRARLINTVGFTAGQETGIDLVFARAFTAAVTGGTATTLTTDNGKRRTSWPTTSVSSMPIATTAALTAGTHVLDAQPMRTDGVTTIATVAQVAKPEIYLSTEDLDRYPVVLRPNEGLIIRNTVAQGAGGSSRLVVEIDWFESARF